ncbi:MAG: restriction endonuclease subunit S [Corynebacterium striatum]|nr:restriction endonuclease subunit S [Corynebacterium striatum]
MAGNAKHDWPMVRLGDVCEISIGKTPARKNPEYWGEGYPWLSIRDMNQGRSLSDTAEQITDLAVRETSPRLCEPGTVLFSFKLSIGKVGIAQIPLYTNEAIAAFVPLEPETLLNEYLFHALQYFGTNLEGQRAVMGQTLNKASLSQITIPLPPLDEQRRIAAILDEVGALIAKVGTEMSNLQKTQQSRLDGVFRHFPQAPLRMYVESIQSGKSLKEASTNDVRNRVLKISSVTSGTFEPEESKPLPDDYIPPEAHRVQKGDVLVSRANTADLVGASVLVMEEVSNLYLPDKLWRLNLTQGTRPAAIVGILQNAVVRSRISAKASGSGGSMKNITQKAFLQVLVPNMCTSEQVELSNFLFEIGRVRKLLTQKKTLLETLQRSLSARAFQGEL